MSQVKTLVWILLRGRISLYSASFALVARRIAVESFRPLRQPAFAPQPRGYGGHDARLLRSIICKKNIRAATRVIPVPVDLLRGKIDRFEHKLGLTRR